VKEQPGWAQRFRVIQPIAKPSRAWFVPLTAISQPEMLDSWNGDIESLLKLFDRAIALESTSSSPECLDLSFEAQSPGWVIITQLADPQWQARWSGEDGAGAASAQILPTFRRDRREGGWQRIRVPEPGPCTLHLEYVASDVRQGIVISGIALAVWVIVLTALEIRSGRKGDGG
jgi:hypothetical protein